MIISGSSKIFGSCALLLLFGTARAVQAQAAERVIIDTDPGTDDALAILLALRSPELRVEALTVVAESSDGNMFVAPSAGPYWVCENGMYPPEFMAMF